MMNQLRTISAASRLAVVDNGSRCRLYMAAPMEPIAARSVDEVFVMTMHHGSGISVGNFRRSMSTSAGKGRNSGENVQKNIGEKIKDSGAVQEEKKESTEPPCLKEKLFYLRQFPAWRNEEELRNMFELWNDYQRRYPSESETMEKRRFNIFKEKVRFIEEMTARNLGFRLTLDRFSIMTPKEYFRKKHIIDEIESNLYLYPKE